MIAFNISANTFAAGRSVFYNNATGSGEGSVTILAGRSISSESNVKVASLSTSITKASKIKLVAKLNFSVSDNFFASFDGNELL